MQPHASPRLIQSLAGEHAEHTMQVVRRQARNLGRVVKAVRAVEVCADMAQHPVDAVRVAFLVACRFITSLEQMRS
jgi:hypothetical protein